MTEEERTYQIEEGDRLMLDFNKLAQVAGKCPDVLPVAVQNADTREVILVAYVNKEALQASLETRIATFWSSSRNELWVKGETSGQYYEIVEIRVNCEQNSLLFKVRPRAGGICHTSNKDGQPRNCYYRVLNLETGLLENTDP